MENKKWQDCSDKEKTLAVIGIAEIVGTGYTGPLDIRSYNGGILSTTPAMPPALNRRNCREVSKKLAPLIPQEGRRDVRIWLNRGLPNPK